MAGVAVTWQADPDPNVVTYKVFFTVTPAGGTTPNPTLTATIPAVAGQTNYTTDYNNLTPTPPTLNNGDSVAVAAQSVDSFGQSSPMIVAAGSPVVISIAPPPGPTGPVNLTAAQS